MRDVVRVLVLGGTGFLGRHVVSALAENGHQVIIGSRRPACSSPKFGVSGASCAWREARFERVALHEWDQLIDGVDVVVNCVGILRERGRATYDVVHHRAPAALARACARAGAVRLVHVSALGLRVGARSGFIRSKISGEIALRESGCTFTLVRPSLLEGSDGYGARWIRAAARIPLHIAPSDAVGRIAVLDVGDAGVAIAKLCEESRACGSHEVELGGAVSRTFTEHLAALRRVHSRRAATCVRIPATVALLLSHVCDLLHVSPFSFGHLELLRHDNVPVHNRLPALLGRPPRAIGAEIFESLPVAAAVADAARD